MSEVITLVTGNPGKLLEYEALLKDVSKLVFKPRKLSLPELQLKTSRLVVEDKLARAYDIVKAPVIVEDVSAGLDKWHGLPGPFYKFFEEDLGKTALLQLAGRYGEPITITCIAGFYDGRNTLIGEGTLHGTVGEPRGENGFGFDAVVVPDGEKLTLAEMTYDEKNAISHRFLAIQNLLPQILGLNNYASGS